MNALDVSIIVILTASVTYSLYRGLIEEVFSLLAIGAGFFGATYSYSLVTPLLEPYISRPGLRPVVAYGLLFLGISVALTLVGMAVKKLITFLRLRWLDRFGGAVFGLVKGIVVAAILVFAATTFLPEDTPLVKHSQLTPMFLHIVDLATTFVPEDLNAKYQDKRTWLLKWWGLPDSEKFPERRAVPTEQTPEKIEQAAEPKAQGTAGSHPTAQ